MYLKLHSAFAVTALSILLVFPASTAEPDRGYVAVFGPGWPASHFDISERTDIVQLSINGTQWVALGSNGTVYPTNTAPPDLDDVVQVDAGPDTSIAVSDNGSVTLWGGRTYVPEGLADVTEAATGQAHSVALLENGTVVAWGENTYGQCNVPPGLDNVVHVDAGAYFSLALKSDGTVVAWGWDTNGELDVPADLHDVTEVAAGSYFAMARQNDGTVFVWGSKAEDAPLEDLTDAAKIAASGSIAMVLRSDGSSTIWGGTRFDTDLPDLTSATQIQVNEFMAAAVMPVSETPAVIHFPNQTFLLDLMTIPLEGTTNSTVPISYAITSGNVCSISGDAVYAISTGVCEITASVPNTPDKAAASHTATFTITPEPPDDRPGPRLGPWNTFLIFLLALMIAVDVLLVIMIKRRHSFQSTQPLVSIRPPGEDD